MMGKRRRSLSFRKDSEPGQVEKEERRKRHIFPLTKNIKHRSNTTVSFNCSGAPFPGDKIDTSFQFSRTVRSEREMNYINRNYSRGPGRWRKAKSSRVSMREGDHAATVRVAHYYYKSLNQNRKTSFLPTSSPNKKPFSTSFQAAGSCEILSPEKVGLALDNRKGVNIRRRPRKRGNGSRHDVQHMAHSLPQSQSNFISNHSSAMQIPERGNYSKDTNGNPLPAANKSALSAEKGEHSLINATFDDSKDVCIPSEVNLDSPNCSDIRKRGKEFNMARKQKLKCLKNDVHENHSADTASLPESIIYKVERALRSPFRKKLLVLDLNGILCDVVFGSHGSRLPYKKVSMRSVFKRPFLNDFLAFCFERFVVGIWSSRNRNNVSGVINYLMEDFKDRLLFCWDQSKCTVTGFNTIGNRHKPLVLKELIKLWDKEEASLPWIKGEYSPTNTLLVDDSPYKALCNPPHTAIFPFPYDFRDESDSVLGPGGAIRVYLESIAIVDDVQEHVRKHSFGQQAITSEDKMWSFYKNIIDKKNSMALTRDGASVAIVY